MQTKTNMATATTSVKKLSHKNFRKLLKKFRRKRLRKKAALEREELCPPEIDVLTEEPDKPLLDNGRVFTCQTKDGPPRWIVNDSERQFQHQLWLQREEAAQKEFLWKQALKERLKAEREEQERRIRLEWEEQQRLNKAAEDEKSAAVQTRKNREAALLNDITSKLEEDPTHNPEAPGNFGTEKDRQNCPFFLKTGACRFAERCSRFHLHPNVSCTILIPGMYHHFGISESFRDEYDTDISLEYEDGETYTHFREFYEDVVPEFKKAGDILQFKTCCNHEPHLRGNVYIQFKREEAAIKAFNLFNGRWYAGKQLSCAFTNITKWKSAICGLFSQKRCPKGKNCNFLHVFRNPRDEFCEADHDFEPSPWQNRFGSYRSRSPHSSRSSRPYYSSHRPYNHHNREQVKRSHSHRSNAASPHNKRSRTRSRSRSKTRSRSRSPRHQKSSQRRSDAVSYNNRSRSRSRSRSKTRSRSASPRSLSEKTRHKKSSTRKKYYKKKSKKQPRKKKTKSRRSSPSSNSSESVD